VNSLSRRDALVLMLQALLLSLFPWMRTEEGAQVALRGAETMVSRAIYKTGSFHITWAVKGFEVTDEMRTKFAAVDLGDGGDWYSATKVEAS